eukprot:GSA25T00010689001.1
MPVLFREIDQKQNQDDQNASRHASSRLFLQYMNKRKMCKEALDRKNQQQGSLSYDESPRQHL